MQVNEALAAIYKGVFKCLEEEGFSPVLPDGNEKGNTPVFDEGGKKIIRFTSEKGSVKLVHEDKELSLLTSANGNAENEDFKNSSTSLLDPESVNESDINYIIDEFSETLRDIYSEKSFAKNASSKVPVPVSKSAAKSGVASYDPNTLANRLFSLYPELKEPYKENIDKYGEFLPEEFFQGFMVNRVMDTIKNGDKQKKKKLFNILNEIYEDGTNETQSLIVVTVLGSMDNDPELLGKAEPYMSEVLKDPVIAVNRFFATRAGKKARQKLENPPPYKPKKEKSKQKGILAQMLGI